MLQSATGAWEDSMTTILPRVAAFAVLLSVACVPRVEAADAPVATPPDAALAALTGRWIVDLRPSPEEPAYDKPMTLAIAADRTVSGTFYESDIEAGRASASNGRACFAFRTTDGVGPYHTSGCLVGNRILGQTWAEHRKFVLNWTAMRE
jgi:hypothetical protein